MKILFIACYSPLINNSASIETLQYLNKLNKIEGNEIHLLTVNFPKNSIYYDEYLLSMMDSSISIHAIDGGKIFDKIMPKKSSSTASNTNSKTSRRLFLRKIKNLVAVPDMYGIWALKASRYGKKLLKENSFDVIFSMHEPPSSHLCAYLIKKEVSNIPWITYWSDPWVKDSTREKANFIRKYFEKYLEKKVVNNTDRLIFVTKENMQDYINTYNLNPDKCHVLNRGYDKEIYDKLRNQEIPRLINKNKINIVYAGEIFTKLRDVNPFIKAIKELKNENSNVYNRLNILFFGNIDDDNVKDELTSEEIVKVSGRIPYNEALKYMLNSDVLLLFGNKNSKQIPGKIYDYFGTDAWVLNIYGDDKDPIIPLVENHYKCLGVKNEKEMIKEAIVKLSRKIDEGEYPLEDMNYEWETVAKRLNKILGED
ncbi:glycosyltransferase [Clostridium paridis]|uniref:Glycosyltransferase n=1 Tax=Clostridium paridis TaxID=2803863 RepID=A0A937K3R5_9CLOT|nr:glycosyltransferase [Clostridium paridis]MBL4931064.1 glycosyltransferase [Clostridium paridis]